MQVTIVEGAPLCVPPTNPEPESEEETLKPKEKTKRKNFKPLSIVNKILENQHILFSGGTFYRFDRGCCRQIYQEELDRLTIRILGESAKRSSVTDVRFFAERVTFVRPDQLNPPGRLNCKNGLLDMSTSELLPHDPSFYSTTQSDVVINPEAKCPLWLKFLERVLPDPQERALLQEVMGYCLTFETKHHKAFILFGEGSNGKSVVLFVLENLLGSANVSSLTLPDLREKFRLAELQGKLANIVYEIDAGGLISDGKFKNIVAGDPVFAEKKYGDPFKFIPSTKWILATNKLPDSHDKSHGYFRRLSILPFNVRIPEEEQDKELKNKIVQTELSGVLNWAVMGYARLQKNGKFTEPESVTRALELYREDVDPALVFIRETLRTVGSGQVLLQATYNLYREWCSEAGHKKLLTRRNLSKAIQRELKVLSLHTREGVAFAGVGTAGA